MKLFAAEVLSCRDQGCAAARHVPFECGGSIVDDERGIALDDHAVFVAVLRARAAVADAGYGHAVYLEIGGASFDLAAVAGGVAHADDSFHLFVCSLRAGHAIWIRSAPPSTSIGLIPSASSPLRSKAALFQCVAV